MCILPRRRACFVGKELQCATGPRLKLIKSIGNTNKELFWRNSQMLHFVRFLLSAGCFAERQRGRQNRCIEGVSVESRLQYRFENRKKRLSLFIFQRSEFWIVGKVSNCPTNDVKLDKAEYRHFSASFTPPFGESKIPSKRELWPIAKSL
jgi:hypothetical protein